MLPIIQKAFFSSLHAIGQSTGSLVFWLATVCVAAGWIWFREGRTKLKDHITRKILLTIAIALVAFLPFFLWHLGYEQKAAEIAANPPPAAQEPAREPRNSLRRRVARLADELDYLLREQVAVLRTPQQLQTMTPEQRDAANRAYDEATRKTTMIYLNKFRARTVGIIAELKPKGLLTEPMDGPLEKGAEFRMLLYEEIHRLRELAYHLDGQDRVVRFM